MAVKVEEGRMSFYLDFEDIFLRIATAIDPEGSSRDETDLTAAPISGIFRNFMLIWRPSRRRRSNRWSSPPWIWISAVTQGKRLI